MAEGGLLHWKIQKVKQFGPTTDYSRLRDPLPDPPKGMVWHHDKETHEWKLVKEKEPEVIIDGGPTDADSSPADAESSHPAATTASGEEEWDLVSDNSPADEGSGLLLARPGPVCSINSDTKNLSTMKINRRSTSSSIDSAEGGVPGVDYTEHVVLPTDTLQGICLAYKITATRLRQANQFSGSTLLLAPKRLVIPINKQALQNGRIRIQDKNSREFKIQAFLAERPDLWMAEAKAYLDIADWDLDDALREAREDGEWEQNVKGENEEGVAVNLETTAGGPKMTVPVEIYEGVPADTPVTPEAEQEQEAEDENDNSWVEMQPLLEVDESTPQSVTPERNVVSQNDDSWVEMPAMRGSNSN